MGDAKPAPCERLCDVAWAGILAQFSVPMSPREEQVARHLAEGGEGRGLEKLLGLQSRTVRELMRRVYSKAKVRRREQFMALVARHYRQWRSSEPPELCQ